MKSIEGEYSKSIEGEELKATSCPAFQSDVALHWPKAIWSLKARETFDATPKSPRRLEVGEEWIWRGKQRISIIVTGEKCLLLEEAWFEWFQTSVCAHRGCIPGSLQEVLQQSVSRVNLRAVHKHTPTQLVQHGLYFLELGNVGNILRAFFVLILHWAKVALPKWLTGEPRVC